MLRLQKRTAPDRVNIELPGSKSISNRFLMLKALYNLPTQALNLSTANDTVFMQSVLTNRQSGVIYVGDAGTVARFALASAIFGPFPTYISGSESLHTRPFKDLILALENLGAEFEFPIQSYHMPLVLTKFHQKNHQIPISTSISSQFTSALMMVGPGLDTGLILNLKGENNSEPYIQMTASVMRDLGFDVGMNAGQIHVNPYENQATPKYYQIESDWSSASFFIMLLAGMPIGTQFAFDQLFEGEKSYQGDQAILKFAGLLGISSSFEANRLICIKERYSIEIDEVLDFSSCPDLALPVCFMLCGLKCTFMATGIDTLMFKESNRKMVLIQLMSKFNVIVHDSNGRLEFDARNFKPCHEIFETFNDHRVAMSLAILSVFLPIALKNPEVVAKSFPGFWNELSKAGIGISTS